ncbi:hypothetical protein EKO04_004124 [Ascochyta lentis]|uniref:Uncharacterized protein n=1 Tax=Ascochyta lentis TaxID=205686 RepID=A0A8H7J7E4_9PLEO|nr:hypothetical protein EKO04_004124 [Ascochyta lentis]
MRNHNGCRVVLLLAPALFLLFPAAVLVFVLERISKSLLLEHTYRNYRSGTYMITLTDTDSTGSTDVTMRIDQAPMLAILGVCVAALVFSAVDVFGIWELKKVEGTSSHQRMWAWVAAICNIVMAAISLAVFGWASSLQRENKSWQTYEDMQRQDRDLTRETWSCQIDQYYLSERWASAACGTAKATRFLLVPLAIFSLLVNISLWLLVHQRGGFGWLCGGKGRYAGFDNVYELQQSGRLAPHMQPLPQWTTQPCYVVQPVQLWTPQQLPQSQKEIASTDARAVTS